MRTTLSLFLLLAIASAFTQENGLTLFNPSQEQDIISKLGCVIVIKNIPKNGDISALISPYQKLAELYQESLRTTVSLAVQVYQSNNLQVQSTQIKPLRASFFCTGAKVVPLSSKKDIKVVQPAPKLSTTLTLQQILNSTWNFYNSDRDLGQFVFQKGGKIAKYNNDNQRFWSFDGQILTVMNKDKAVTAKYVSAERDYFGKWHLWGIFWPSAKQWIHYLVQK